MSENSETSLFARRADLLQVVEHEKASGLVDEPDHRLLGARAEDLAVVAQIGDALGVVLLPDPSRR